MPISTAATELPGIDCPIVSAPMDAVAGGRLAAAGWPGFDRWRSFATTVGRGETR